MDTNDKKSHGIWRVKYQTLDGRWHSLEEENADLDEYRVVQYYEIFHKK